MFYVYILATKYNKMLYIGVTNNLEGRVRQHQDRIIDGYTKKYNVTKLVHFEEYQYVYDAIAREKRLKNWHKQWKINQITKYNPDWQDLAADWHDSDPETSSG